MQPYFFPYVGYFDMIAKVDLFVLLDDVQYIRRGWVNRNKITSSQWLTVPIKHCPRSTLIKDVLIDNEKEWLEYHTAVIQHLYGKAGANHPLIQMYHAERHDRLSDLLCRTLAGTRDYLNIKTPFLRSSTLTVNFQDSTLSSAEQKIIGLCKALGARHYVNATGGKALYDIETFRAYEIQLEFMEPCTHHNKLSILDCCIRENYGRNSLLLT